MTQHRERAKPLSPDERRQAIIDAVIPLLDPNAGPITTRQIAEAAGIAEGTIFRVFPDKRTLFHALAEEVSNPPGSDEALLAAYTSVDDLRTKVVLTISQLMERTQKMMVVMFSLRVSLSGEVLAEAKPGDARGPEFLTRANQRLLTFLTDKLFGPHRSELTVTPEIASTTLQGLVFGLAHPTSPLHPTADEIASLLLDGIYDRDN